MQKIYGALAAFVLGSSSSAFAGSTSAPLPPASYIVQAGIGTPYILPTGGEGLIAPYVSGAGTGYYVYQTVLGTTSGLSIVDSNSVPVISTSAAGGPVGAQSASGLTYAFEVLGPANTTVPVDVHFMIGGMASGQAPIVYHSSAETQASFQIAPGYAPEWAPWSTFSSGGPRPEAYPGLLNANIFVFVPSAASTTVVAGGAVVNNTNGFFSGACPGGSTICGLASAAGVLISTTGTQEVSILSDTLYSVTMMSYSFSEPFGNTYGIVDPYISIDSSFAANNPDYSLAFSPGIINAPLGARGPAPDSGLATLAFLTLAGAMAKVRDFRARGRARNG
jgi:hypothetical protein